MNKEDIVIKLCGNYPKDFESIDIQSNPNFVFENDPNFEAVKLFDHDENTVFVNSFVECEHYVNGGWDFFPELKNENFYHNSLLGLSILIFLVGSYIMKKIVKSDA